MESINRNQDGDKIIAPSILRLSFYGVIFSKSKARNKIH